MVKMKLGSHPTFRARRFKLMKHSRAMVKKFEEVVAEICHFLNKRNKFKQVITFNYKLFYNEKSS